MSQQICQNFNCYEPIFSYHHQNRRYCSEHCYYENKLMVTNMQNEQRRSALNIANNDDILKLLYAKFGEKKYFSAAILESKMFDWSLRDRDIFKETLKVRIVKNYGYTLFNDETILLWKI